MLQGTSICINDIIISLWYLLVINNRLWLGILMQFMPLAFHVFKKQERSICHPFCRQTTTQNGPYTHHHGLGTIVEHPGVNF